MSFEWPYFSFMMIRDKRFPTLIPVLEIDNFILVGGSTIEQNFNVIGDDNSGLVDTRTIFPIHKFGIGQNDHFSNLIY